MKRLYRVPMESYFNTIYHYILAESKEQILQNRKKIQEHFKGEGIVVPNIDRYKIWDDDLDIPEKFRKKAEFTI